MTPDQAHIINKLSTITRRAGFDTVFIDNLSRRKDIELTEKQDEFLYRVLYRYRDKLPHTYSQYKDHKFCRAKRVKTPIAKPSKNWEKLYK